MFPMTFKPREMYDFTQGYGVSDSVTCRTNLQGDTRVRLEVGEYDLN